MVRRRTRAAILPVPLLLLALTQRVRITTAEAYCSREKPCDNKGSCHELLGICSCPLGFGGHSCEKDLTPACRHSHDPLPDGSLPSGLCYTKDVLHLKSCACIRQCTEHGAWGLIEGGSTGCFDRADLPAEQQTSRFPAEGEAGVVYYRTLGGEQITREQYMAVTRRENGLRDWEPKPPSACAGSCSFMGHCEQSPNQQETRCWCFYGRDGPDCATDLKDACLNDCSNRGTCLRGFCSCQKGFFGIDCSIDLEKERQQHVTDPLVEDDEPDGDHRLEHLQLRQDQPKPQAGVRHKIKLSVYIYELPTWLNLAYEIDHMQWQAERGMYSAYWRMYSELLHDWEVRTLNPYEANVFYVPTFSYALLNNGGIPHGMTRRVIRYLQSHYPLFWNRFNGADHVFWFTGDRGMCPLPDDLSQLIWLTHYGQTNYSLAEDEGNAGRCFDINRDIVTPPVVIPLPGEAESLKRLSGHGVQTERKTLLYFAGSFKHAHVSYEARRCCTLVGQKHYSQGVRQKVYELYHGRGDEGFKLVEHSNDMIQDMFESVFCLAPSGHGWGIRIVYAMMCGCIPVVIQDGIHQPYDDVLPYHEFSVRVPQKDIDKLDRILKSIAPEEVRELQHGVGKYEDAFMWRSVRAAPEGGYNDGKAYDFLIQSLQKRLYSIFSVF